MTDGGDTTAILATAADQETEAYHGITFPGLYAMFARAHMEKYGTTEEDLAWVSVKNHRHGNLNPKAQFRREVTVEEVLKSAMVSEPLRLLHCSPVSDGAAAILLCPADQASKYTDKPVKIIGSGFATSSIALADREDPAFLDAVARSAEKAFKMAGIGPTDIHLAEVHDCFCIAEIGCIEALGIVEKGKGGEAARSGQTALGGTISRQHQRRPEVQRTPRRRYRDRSGHRDLRTTAGRSRRAPGRGRPHRPRSKHGWIGSQLRGSHF